MFQRVFVIPRCACVIQRKHPEGVSCRRNLWNRSRNTRSLSTVHSALKTGSLASQVQMVSSFLRSYFGMDAPSTSPKSSPPAARPLGQRAQSGASTRPAWSSLKTFCSTKQQIRGVQWLCFTPVWAVTSHPTKPVHIFTPFAPTVWTETHTYLPR